MLPQSFYEEDAVTLARKLIGCELVHDSGRGLTSGVIVETEAYSQDDAASHSFKGVTNRTRVMFGAAGHVYVYFTYGMHYCFNVVCGPAGHGQAVLIRALKPLNGVELMKKRRNRDAEHELCNGPAKLVQAMGITMNDYGRPLFAGALYINPASHASYEISIGPRVGITKAVDEPWRFWMSDSKYVSR